MVSIGTIVRNEVFKQFRDMGIDVIWVEAKYEEEKYNEFRLNDIQQMPMICPVVLNVAPMIRSSSEFHYAGKKTNVEQIGATESFFDINKLGLSSGRIVRDIDKDRYFCVIGSDLSAFLAGTGQKKYSAAGSFWITGHTP